LEVIEAFILELFGDFILQPRDESLWKTVLPH
jgi:hypothetical protein